MATRSTLVRFGVTSSMMSSTRGTGGAMVRYFSDGKGRILSEEERAAENVYIQKVEREKMEKMKKQTEKEKAEQEKQGADKKTKGGNKS